MPSAKHQSAAHARGARPRYWMRRFFALGAAVVVAAGVVVLANIGHGKNRPVVKHPPPSTTSSSVPSTEPPAGPPYAVGIVSVNIVVNGNTLPTNIRYPTLGPPGSADVTGATPDRAGGPYPLVVFSQGFDISPEAYASILQAWAAAGYIVADPTYPHTDPNAPGGPNRAYLVNHPADLNGVISQILSYANTPGTLEGVINTSEVAVAGHSDGGDVSLAVVANSLYTSAASNIKAAIIFSGAEYAPFGGAYFPPGARSVPMLVTQGTSDNINPPSCSVQIYNSAPPPKYYLYLYGAGHHSPYLYPTPYERTVTAVSIDFLNHVLKHDAPALSAMELAGNVQGVASITSASSVPQVAGACPGAPPG
ncbi:MAG: hypothetical protein M1121_03330 [Actinobacteria bacterium]|nr:hypothetical protein [Actinomycetota bacterium]